MARPFFQHLLERQRATGTLLCIGLDPDPARVPGDVEAWLGAVIDATRAVATAYKPNSAFFEQLGTDGLAILARTIRRAGDIPVVLDAKRGDVGHTAEAYARAAFEVLGAGAITLSPYLGRDAVDPFLAWEDRAVYVLARTSNPTAAGVQDLLVDGQPLYERIARDAVNWDGGRGRTGLVAGATAPDQLSAIADAAPGVPLLVPGVGAQGGDLEAVLDVVRADRAAGREVPHLVNVSRGILYPQDGLAGVGREAAAWALRLRLP